MTQREEAEFLKEVKKLIEDNVEIEVLFSEY
jgi:hypothetical protein